MTLETWWRKPRKIDVVVDNPSWILPGAQSLVDIAGAEGDDAHLIRDHQSVRRDAIAFYLGCVRITPPEVLQRTRRNLVVHASDLPRGRGFSPLTWLTLAGELTIPVCLFEAAEKVDEGPVVFRDRIVFEGHELIDDMRLALTQKTLELCLDYLRASDPPPGVPQDGAPSYYRRRLPKDSRLDPHATIAEQFDLLRTVDNEHYPSFFDHRGHRYTITIVKTPVE